MFIDEVKVQVKGGKGGNGVTSFARQPYEPKGPPDGGDGGAGGSVILRADPNVATLVDYHHRPHRAAGSGRHGEGDLRRGADGEDVVLRVPVGTVVREADRMAIVDLIEPGAEYVAAAGGRGGRGNAAFKSAQRRAPRFHELGEPPQERWITLELKLVADVALVGFPNAGKSSLIARLSAAKPKIADYPFTTLAPNLGVVKVDELDFVIADVPGLIPGASEGRGLGHSFLRHVERAGVLVHVLDCASYDQRDPREDLDAVARELAAYSDVLRERGEPGADLLQRPALVFLNKTDADAETAEIVRPDLEADGWEVLQGSAVTGEGLDALRHRLADLVRRGRERRVAAPMAALPRPVLRPGARERGFEITRSGEGYRVAGERVQRWVEMTDLSNDEAVRYLQSRLARAGVEQALVKAGARAGDAVEIAGRVFDFEPEPGAVPDEGERDAQAGGDEPAEGTDQAGRDGHAVSDEQADSAPRADVPGNEGAPEVRER